MSNVYLRMFLYFGIIGGLAFVPLSISKEPVKNIFTDRKTVNISIVKPPLKKVAKQVVKQVKKPKPKLKPKPLEKPKPKLKKKPSPKPVPVKKVEPIIEEEIVKKEKVVEAKEKTTEEKVAVESQEEIDQKKELARVIQAKESYSNKIYKIISKNKRYPKRARRLKQEGTVNVSFKVLEDGTIRDIALSEKSKHKALNKAVLKLFKKLKQFPKPPNNVEFPLEYNIAINYKLR